MGRCIMDNVKTNPGKLAKGGLILSLLLLGSCNPFGSRSVILDDGSGIGGLVPTFTTTTVGSTSLNPIPMTATWPTYVVGFEASDLLITGGTLQNFAGEGETFTFEIIPDAEGTITVFVAAGAAVDLLENPSLETTFTIDYDLSPPSAIISKAGGQLEHTASLPVNFTVAFDEAINPASFTASDIVQSGTASGVTWTITDSGDQTTFTLAATAISGTLGSLIPSISAGSISDLAGNSVGASTGSGNKVFYLPTYASTRFWLKADSLSLSNGANVTSWTDGSTNANTAIEATNPPTYIASATNSMPAVAFNGSKLLQSTSNSGMTGNPDFTIFMVSRTNATSGSYSAYLQIGPAGVATNVWFRLEPSSSLLFAGFQNGGSASASNYIAGFALYTWVRNSAGGTNTTQSGNTLFFNGSSVSVNPSLSNIAPNVGAGPFRVGRSNGGFTVNADIAEILVSDLAMNASQRGAVESYLNAKYNLY